ncbi:MAG TPA: hypothetical protein VFZ31_05390 [Vicinamibacterales bacterium]
MNHKITLVTMSLLSIVLSIFHITDDIVRGIEPGDTGTLTFILIATVLLYGTLPLADRRAGFIIMLLGGIGGVLVAYVHMRGGGLVGGRIAGTSGMFFWVFTLIALGTTGMMTAILAAQALWRSFRRPDAATP